RHRAVDPGPAPGRPLLPPEALGPDPPVDGGGRRVGPADRPRAPGDRAMVPDRLGPEAAGAGEPLRRAGGRVVRGARLLRPALRGRRRGHRGVAPDREPALGAPRAGRLGRAAPGLSAPVLVAGPVRPDDPFLWGGDLPARCRLLSAAD